MTPRTIRLVPPPTPRRRQSAVNPTRLAPIEERQLALLLWHFAAGLDVGVELPPYPPRSLAEVRAAIDAARVRWQDQPDCVGHDGEEAGGAGGG